MRWRPKQRRQGCDLCEPRDQWRQLRSIHRACTRDAVDHLRVRDSFDHLLAAVCACAYPAAARQGQYLAAFGLVLGTLLGVVGVAVGLPALGEYGHFSAADTVRSVLAIGLYCAMISMVALGVGTFTRSSAATVSILFLVLLVASTLLGGLGEALGCDWLVTISNYLPNVAGQTFITGADQPYSPLIGLLTLTGWAAAALLTAAAALNTRDA